MNILAKSSPVNTPFGRGKINYGRLSHDGKSVAAYSVMLDHKVEACNKPPFPSYSGTIILAEQVTPIQ